MAPSQMIESYKFWDVVTLWARERLEHEVIIARALARGVIVDGLRFQSVDPRWVNQSQSLSGYPYVGYVAAAGEMPVLLRAETLEHLLAVARAAVEPDVVLLGSEFVTRTDFLRWLLMTAQPLPVFWFSTEDRRVQPVPAFQRGEF